MGGLQMNNEPVAWINRKGKRWRTWLLEWDKDDEAEINTPLYTHPAKTLTDEEIANTWDDVRKDATLKSSMKDIQDFARAILKKASEG
jgi:hypothetical protein